MARLVYYYIPDHSYAVRKGLAKKDPFSALNPSLGTDLETLVLPRTVRMFLSTIVENLSLEVEIQVLAMGLLDRLLSSTCPVTSTKFILHHGNWRPVVLGAAIVACKVYDDKAVYVADFVSCQRGLTPKMLCKLERLILTMVDFKVSLSVSDYHRYWFELRNLPSQGISVSPFKSPVFSTTCETEMEKLKSCSGSKRSLVKSSNSSPNGSPCTTRVEKEEYTESEECSV